MQPLAIRATGLSKSYHAGSDTVPVLHEIDLQVPRGECLFLVGPSGSGKTTLLSILGCVLSADSGDLELLGHDARHFTTSEQARFRRERIGFAFQRYHLFEALTAAENVRVPLDLLGWPAARGRARALELLDLLGLADKGASRVNRLSMGQRQRVAFARALAGDPDLVLADEPTASLDAAAGFNAMRVLKELCNDLRKTVIVVTHDSRIFPLADRTLCLADGRIVSETPSAAVAAFDLAPVTPVTTLSEPHQERWEQNGSHPLLPPMLHECGVTDLPESV